eukprot:CAMPEP_0179012648 /NCGR_PEP_ID=MMETSP0796-20121207/1314_1 /TAXON_ID=73915 /ORGANISM="Pyrodinium bahamense, Strain pbaha01" /LENGTH=32 /DNA_ID= /DNA_START= /DNA_END= /DNA_ORIENTATION=
MRIAKAHAVLAIPCRPYSDILAIDAEAIEDIR